MRSTIRTTAKTPRRVRTVEPFTCMVSGKRIHYVERVRLAGTRSTGRRFYEWRTLGFVEVEA